MVRSSPARSEARKAGGPAHRGPPLVVCVWGGSERIYTTQGDVIESLLKQSLVDSEALHQQLGANAPA